MMLGLTLVEGNCVMLRHLFRSSETDPLHPPSHVDVFAISAKQSGLNLELSESTVQVYITIANVWYKIDLQQTMGQGEKAKCSCWHRSPKKKKKKI